MDKLSVPRRQDDWHICPAAITLAILWAFSAMSVSAAELIHPAMISSTFINENAPYPSCHASTIVETTEGKLVAAWFGGTLERDPDVGIWVARQENGRWLPAVEVANGIQPEGPRLPSWNPVLFQPKNGPLVLFYKIGPMPQNWWGMMITSDDGGKTWTPPRRMADGVLGPIKNKPEELADGTWMSPSSTEGTPTGWRVHFELSRDAGKTWETIGPVDKGKEPELDAIQPSILFHGDGRLQALARTRNGVVASTWSKDGGKTWSALEPIDLPNPNTGTDAVTLADGRQLIVYNHSAPPPERPTKGLRYPLDVAISNDGITWRRVLILEDEPRVAGYAYPAVIQTSDGLVHITYTWDRKLIKHVVLDPKKLPLNAVTAYADATSPRVALRVTDLKTQYSKDPLDIDAQPRLFWRVSSDARGQRQTAWQVLVASSPEVLAKDRGDLWDSGRIASAQTTHVRYVGSALLSSQQAFWKVRAWDRDGRMTPWSARATWTMGLLQPEDWKGIWIAAPSATESLLLRHEFTVKPGLRRAIVHVCGLGHYQLAFNGSKASNDLFSPGWTDYNETTLYDTHDVTPLLRQGRNAVGLILGNGMYNVVRRNRFAKFTGSFGPLRAILHLRLEYSNGKVEFVGTNETWRTSAGPITYNSIYGGEDHNARLERAGWTKPGFNDRSWPPAVTVVRPGGTLRGHSVSAEPLRAIETRQPVSVKRFPDGSVVYDFGQNTTYMPRIRVSGPVGSTVRLTPSEVVNEDGTINRRTTGSAERGSAWWQYTKATKGEETWFPRFYYVGCRYMKAEFFPAGGRTTAQGKVNPARLPRLESLEGVVVHSIAEPTGHFATSNPLVNRIRDLVRWAQRSNMVSVLTDSPHREKLGWIEQYHLNGPAIRYEFDVARIFTKGMQDMADAQTDEGLVPNIAPEYTQFKGAFRSAAEWGAAFILVPWQQYQFNGDLDLLRTHYGAMKKYFAYLESRAKDDILSDGLGDWYDLGPNKPGAAQLTPPPVTATAFYYYDAFILARIAGLLGHVDEATDYLARAERIRARYNRQFYKPETGTYATGSQAAHAIPLVMGIVDLDERPRVLDALVRDVEQHGYAMTAGDVGFRFLLQALAEGGRSDVIYRMINQDEKPGYGYMLKKGATALTESWDANLGASHNHFMLGQITEWLYKELAGIDVDPAGPAFKQIIIRPQPVGDLKWVEASYDSMHGPVSVRWERNGERFTLKTTIPANTTAMVYLPARAGSSLQESGAPTERSRGVTLLRHADGQAIFAVESGRYTFQSHCNPP
jgi:alpha-L-rhamnosidase